MLAFAMAAMTASAQTVLWDGENKELGTMGGFWDRGNPLVVENPEKDGINTSNKCLKFTMTNESKQVACPFRDWLPYPSLNLNGNRRLSFMIMKSKINENDEPTFNSNVLVELSDPTNGADNYWQKVAAWYDGDGKWQKVVLDFSTNGGLNDFPGVMTITANTDAVAVDHYVYIDNIVVEPIPMVGETPLKDVEDGTLEGAITVTGSYMKGTCSNANGDWYDVPYDDFATLKNKVAAGITSIDMKTAIVKNVYNSIDDKNPITLIYDKNPNALIYTTKSSEDDIAEDDIANVVVNGTCATLNLNDGYAFRCPEAFDATTVNLTRSRIAGYNSFVLPFWVSATDLGASKVYTHKEGTTFKLDTDEYNPNGVAGANVPFLADYAAASSDVIVFSDKGVCATGDLGTTFVGVYAPQSAENLYGINNDGKLQKGGSGANIKSFRAYLTAAAVDEAAREISFEGDVTGIENLTPALSQGEGAWYDLQGRRIAQPTKGLYIVNGKKVFVP